MFIVPILNAFAWAIGGEKYFGKWKRGVLCAIPAVIAGLIVHASIVYYALIIMSIWLFQMLFYDKCIKLVWPDSGNNPPLISRLVGICGLFFNGVVGGIMPILFQARNISHTNSLITTAICGFGFVYVCYQSNVLKLSYPICVSLEEVKIFCLKDTWWFACFVFGLLSGLCYLL